MPKRKQFRNIAEGLPSSFVSRNNDVYGYWGIGKLYLHMISNDSMNLKIDLMNKTIEPADDEFSILIDSISNRLKTQMSKRKLSINYLKKAEIIIVAFPEKLPSDGKKNSLNRMNCKLNITDDLNKVYQSEADVLCRKHSPKREAKSTRKY